MKLKSNLLHSFELLDMLDFDQLGPNRAGMRKRLRDGQIFEATRPFRQLDALAKQHDSAMRDRKSLRRSRHAERRGDWSSPRLRAGAGNLIQVAS